MNSGSSDLEPLATFELSSSVGARLDDTTGAALVVVG